MFKKVDLLEIEAPKTMREAEVIIKEMEKYQFAGSAGFQSFWDAYSHIIFFVTYLLPGGVFLFVFVIQKYRMKGVVE